MEVHAYHDVFHLKHRTILRRFEIKLRIKVFESNGAAHQGAVARTAECTMEIYVHCLGSNDAHSDSGHCIFIVHCSLC